MKISVSAIFPVTVPVADVCLPVAILNQSLVEIASVAAGGNYSVVQLAELVDDEDENTTTVLDTI